MKAMVLAAGLGTRLRPLTYAISKPMVPVLDRPVMAHILDLLERHGIDEVIANLHYFPEPIRAYFGERIAYNYEPELLGTAGGVRACRRFFGEQTFLVISGDALTDIDLSALLAHHRAHGGIATLVVKRVPDTREYGVVVHDQAGRIKGFQEKPAPEQAQSDLGNCGIYVFEPEIFDYFPDAPFADFAQDVFPALLAADAPFYIHEIESYWNDIGSLAELRRGTFDALAGALKLRIDAPEIAPGVRVASAARLPASVELAGPILICAGAQIGERARLDGPLVIGAGARIGAEAALRESILMPGAQLPAGAILIGAIAAHGPALAGEMDI
jgi:mannose-1-phosphate guanylyltransferase